MEYITLRISAQTLNTIGAALQELPHKIARPALDEIDRQVKAHLDERTKNSTTGNSDGAANVDKRTDITTTG